MKHLYVIGIGPGAYSKLTGEAMDILNSCEVIAGYSVYVDLLREHFPDKEYVVTGMTREEERCRLAFQHAMKGKTTAMVCSGDSGVYGMAGIILELWEEYEDVEVEVIPGITAALSGGALLGAPLGHDFAIISLSDLLTPWDKICLRLKCAAVSDMVVCLYNPSSRKRADYLKKACDILLEEKHEDTVCGYVRNIGRQGEYCKVLSLRELADEQVDMFTTVFIGNSCTKVVKGKMVTPRGYHLTSNVKSGK